MAEREVPRPLRAPPSWRPLMVKGKRMQTTWRLEWTWGEAGAVTLDALQSDTIASIPTPIVPSGNGLDVALGARLAISFPACQRAWPQAPLFEPSPEDESGAMMLLVVKDVNAASGTLTLNAGTLDSNPNFLANPAAGSRGRLTLILENLT